MAEEQELNTTESINGVEQEPEVQEEEKEEVPEKEPEAEDTEIKKSPIKSKKQKVVDEPEAEPAIAEEEEEAEDSDDEKPEELGSLEKPVEILDRKRDRKGVERLSFEAPTEGPKKNQLDFTKGKGKKLGDVERVKYEVDKIHSDDLKPLHRLIYGREGKSSEIKKNIRAFCGFPFEVDSGDYKKKDWGLEKFTNPGLKFLCELFALENSGKREELKERVMEFLMKPYDSGKPVPVKVAKKDKAKKRKRSKKDKDEKPSKKDGDDDEAADDDDDEDEADKADTEGDDEEENEGNDEGDDEGDDDNDEKPPKKRKRTEKKPKAKPKEKKKAAVKLPTPKKKKKEEKPKRAATPRSATKKKPDKKSKEDSDSDSDDEPLAKKAKPPTDDVIEDAVKEILEGADLETVTMKTVCKQVYDKFPGYDITDRKSFIKDTVKRIIS